MQISLTYTQTKTHKPNRVSCLDYHPPPPRSVLVFKLREKEKLHFSPSCIFGELDLEDKERLIHCYRDRVYGYYLNPAKLLDEERFGFGCGLMCTAMIDSLARIVYPREKVGRRIVKWLKRNIKDFRTGDFAYRFYKDFRCGLVHEGRIKNPGEFSYDSKRIITCKDGIIRVNPQMLLQRLEEAVEGYLASLEENPDAFTHFQNKLREDFQEEIERERQSA